MSVVSSRSTQASYLDDHFTKLLWQLSVSPHDQLTGNWQLNCASGCFVHATMDKATMNSYMNNQPSMTVKCGQGIVTPGLYNDMCARVARQASRSSLMLLRPCRLPMGSCIMPMCLCVAICTC